MAGINTAISLTDRITGTLNKVATTQERVARTAERMNQNTRRIAPAQIEMGNSAQTAGGKVANMWNKFKGYVIALFAIQAVTRALRALFGASDTFSSIQARLNLINDGSQTTAQLNEKIYRTAQRSRAEYTAMASSVAKLNMLTNGVFKNNDESIRFLELVNKSFTVAGASAEEQKSAMLQLTQAMASGRLQGDELRSISENSPMILQAIEKYAGISRAELRKMAAEGKITSELIKNSIFAAAEDIESKFSKVPMTIGQAWTTFLNYLQVRLQPVFQMLQDALRSDEFKQFVAAATVAIDALVWSVMFLAQILGIVWNTVVSIYQFFANNWSTIGPIVTGIAAALAVVYGYMLAMRIIEAIRAAWEALNATVQIFNMLVAANPIVAIGMIVIAILIGIAVATIGVGETVELVFGIIGAALYGLAAIAFNIFVAIWNIVVTVVEAVVNAFIMGVDFIKTLWWGFLVVIGTIAETIANIFIDVINFLLEKWNDFGHGMNQLWYNIGKGVAKMAEAAGGVVDGLINAVLGGIEDMINKALGGINSMIEAVNKIPGVNIGTLSNVTLGRSNIAGAAKAWGDSMAAPVKGAAAKLERMQGIAKSLAGDKPQGSQLWTAPRASFANVGDAAADGYNAGRGFGKGIVNGVQGILDKVNNAMNPGAHNPFNAGGAGLGGIGGATPFDPSMLGGGNGKGPKGGKLDKVDEVGLSDEYMKLIKDVAEMKWQQTFVTIKPEIVNNLEVRDDRDTQDFIAKFNDQLLDAVENQASGLLHN